MLISRLARSVAVAGAMLLATPVAAQTSAWTLPPDAEIQDILAKRIDVERQGVGIVVGVIDGHGRRIIAHGARKQGDNRALFPEGPKDFFWKIVDAQLTFQTGADGVATAAVLHQAGATLIAPRLPQTFAR